MQKVGPKTKEFFIGVLKRLQDSGIPFLVGGGYAMKRHTGMGRSPRDLDVFVQPSDAERVLELFASLGYRVDMTFPHWLGKIHMGRAYVDVIFSSGNGIATVDGEWFANALEEVVLGQPVRICPAEEMIWSKAFVMERERFDGADVIHLILARGRDLHWPRLLERFEGHRLVLLSHLVLLLFVYPSESGLVPDSVWDTLTKGLEEERERSAEAGHVCRGSLLSRSQYLQALKLGFRDARLPPDGTMRRRDVATWTDAAKEEEAP